MCVCVCVRARARSRLLLTLYHVSVPAHNQLLGRFVIGA